MTTKRYGTVAAIVILALGLAMPTVADGQPQRTHRIGWLISATRTNAPVVAAVAAFRQELRNLGYVEGRNLVIEHRFAEGIPTRLPGLAAELVALNVDVIVTDTSGATHAAQQSTATIPIVMAFSASPVEQGLVRSLASPGGNITGVSMITPDLARKRLGLLKDLLPTAKRVAVLRTPLDATMLLQWRATEEAARALGLELQAMEVQGPAPDFDRVFEAASRWKADAFVVLADQLFGRDRTQIVALAARHRLPGIYFERLFVDAGGLMSYGPSIADAFPLAATYVDKILKGAKPGDLPVQQPAKFYLILNRRTADALPMAFPPILRNLSDEILR